MFAPAYLDHNATTPVDARVLEAMLPWFSRRHGNASSRHEYGRAARAAVDEARMRVAMAVGAHATEVVFTSGGTEGNNLFLRGAAAEMKGGIVAISAVEHPSVREPARALQRQGWRMREVAVDGAGRVATADFSAALAERPAIVSVMLANNETGVLQDVGMLAEMARPTRAWFHTDAVQALGKMPVDFRALNARGVHALTVSAHKIGGPKGAGALVVDKRLELVPQLAGGGQERGLRSGTENVPAIVGFGAACQLVVEQESAAATRLLALRGELERGLAEQGATIFGLAAERLPNTIFFALPAIDGETLVGKLDRAGFAVASGSACSSVDPEPSHVLMAMGVAPDLAQGAVRISLGRDATEQEARDFLGALAETAFQLRRLAALAG
ncbi:MAG: cysteine desulfurase [Rhodocyclales bacterium]|nr:cysteine desulfurase [Rhodocyclales bacterium]